MRTLPRKVEREAIEMHKRRCAMSDQLKVRISDERLAEWLDWDYPAASGRPHAFSTEAIALDLHDCRFALTAAEARAEKWEAIADGIAKRSEHEDDCAKLRTHTEDCDCGCDEAWDAYDALKKENAG
jgi:hypothetical protein